MKGKDIYMRILRLGKLMYTNITLIVVYFIFIGINVSFNFITLDRIKYLVLSFGVLCLFPIYIINLFVKRTKIKYIYFDSLELIWFIFTFFICLITYFHEGIVFTQESILYINLGVLLVLFKKALVNHDLCLHRNIFALVLCILGVYQALFGVIQYYFFEDDLGIYKTLVTGSIIYINCYGSFMIIAFSSLLLLIFKNSFIKTRSLLIILIVLFILVIYWNRSRGAILSAAISVIILVFLYLYQNKYNLRLSIIKLCSIYSILILTVVLVFIVLFNLDIESSHGRLMILKISEPMFWDNLWTGIGLNKFDQEYLHYQQLFFQNPDNIGYAYKVAESVTMNNQYLKYFIELGIFGGLIFMLLWIIVIYKCMFYRKDLGYWFVFVCVILFVHLFFDSLFSSITISSLFIMILSFLPSDYYKVSLDNRVIRILFLSIFITLICILYTINIQMYKESKLDKYERLAEMFLQYAKYDYSLYNSRQALAINPSSIQSKYCLGRALIGNSTLNPDSIQRKEDIKEGIELLNEINGKVYYRDYYLALSYGLLKVGQIDNSVKYAILVHEMFREQLRPILLLSIINYCSSNIPLGKMYLDECIQKSQDINKTNYNQIHNFSLKIKMMLDSQPENIDSIMNNQNILLSLDSIMIAH